MGDFFQTQLNALKEKTEELALELEEIEGKKNEITTQLSVLKKAQKQMEKLVEQFDGQVNISE